MRAYECMIRLTKLFEWLNEFGIVVNPEKCLFGAFHVERTRHFPGTGEGKIISPVTSNLHLLDPIRRYLGMLNFYLKSTMRWFRSRQAEEPVHHTHSEGVTGIVEEQLNISRCC